MDLSSGVGRYALKMAYDGRVLFGSQIQNGSRVRTAAGELTRVLAKSGFMDEGGKVTLASRTDRGVSALCNVAAYSGKKPIVGKLNHHLPPDVCVWGTASVPGDFNPRHCVAKTYLYFLPNTGQDEDKLRRALGCFVGLRDFANFSYGEPRTEAILDEASLEPAPGFFVIRMRAGKFLRLQIRKMVATADAVASGRMDFSMLERLLFDKAFRKGADTAPAEGLVLVDVDYGGAVRFEDHPKNLSERFRQEADSALRGAAALSVLGGLVAAQSDPVRGRDKVRLT